MPGGSVTTAAPAPDEDAVVGRLRAAGCVFAEDEARLLVAEAGSPAQLEALVLRRISGEPLEQVLGWVEFCGLRIALAPGVFVPRRRTELLAEQAAALAPPRAAVVVDLCCGSGAVAAVLGARLDDAEVHASDVDPAAVACARCNLPRAPVHAGDLFDALPTELLGRVDVLVANVPYVPSDAITLMPPEARDHEPRTALDGGRDGLDVARRVAAGAGDWLAPGGSLLFEVGDAQVSVATAVVAAAGLLPRVAADEETGATVIIGTRPPS
jgi:release factor glutamine methyltransferase